MSKTALLTSADENFKLAFHLSKVPLIGTEDSTPNLMVLSTGVISYTGTCARLADGKAHNANTHRVTMGKPRVLALARLGSLVVWDQFSLASSRLATPLLSDFIGNFRFEPPVRARYTSCALLHNEFGGLKTA